MRIEEYQVFGALWEQHLHPYRACFSNYTFPIIAKNNENGAELNTIIHLPEWPMSSAKKKHRQLDILVHARERFTSGSPYKIQESKITVTYWDVDRSTNKATPLSTIRYDYDHELRASHPVYHVHCSEDPVSEGTFPQSWCFTRSDEPNRKSRWPFRIPTPCMCLCNVLIGLVADHLPCDQFKSLLEAIEQKPWIPPLAERCELWSLGRANADPRVLHNWQWYFWPECNC